MCVCVRESELAHFVCCESAAAATTLNETLLDAANSNSNYMEPLSGFALRKCAHHSSG